MSVLSVSIVCPTYGRPQFLPFLLKFFHWQNYPQDKIDLLILDHRRFRPMRCSRAKPASATCT